MLTLPTDADTWVVFLSCASHDRLLKPARNTQTWERIVRAVPHAAASPLVNGMTRLPSTSVAFSFSNTIQITCS